jgi:predicted acyltransferase
LPAPDFDYERAGVSSAWLAEHGLTGFAAHWQRGSNPAAAFDVWFLNLFPRTTPHSSGHAGLTTLNFVPLIGTMILGLMAGALLRSERHPGEKVRWLAGAGVAGIAAGALLGWAGVCPVVKTLWTPSWVLLSGGWCFLFLAAAYAWVDWGGHRKWAAPLVVIGMNSIVAYCLARTYPHFAFNSLRRVFGWETFRVFGEAFEPVCYGVAVLATFWAGLFVLYRLKVFIRI